MTESLPQSAVPGLAWPAVPGRAGQSVLALLYQLEQSQWWPPEALRAQQFRQLQALLAHAAKTVPHFRKLFKDLGLDAAKEITPDSWARIPVLSRREVQDSFDGLRSRALPKSHGRTNEVFTSGSTGMPIKVVKTQLAQLFWQAFTLREHFWHGRDFSRTLAAIRATKSSRATCPWRIRTHAATGSSKRPPQCFSQVKLRSAAGCMTTLPLISAGEFPSSDACVRE